MDDSAKTGLDPNTSPPSSPDFSVADADEFANVRRRTRHPALAAGAAILALFLIAKMRSDLTFFLSGGSVEDLGDARALLSSEKGPGVLAQGTNRVVRIHGTPDRESALQIDTKGSWTFSQFFRILGTGSRLFIHRREDPLPAARAEQDVFEGRLMRFSDLSFEDSIRTYFSGHVSATHFFRTADIHALLSKGIGTTAQVRDLAGDEVTLGPNDILAVDIRHPDLVDVALTTKRFPNAADARTAIEGKGAHVVGPAPSSPSASPDRHVWRITVSPETRDAVMNAIPSLDYQADLREVRETVKVRLADLHVATDTPPETLLAKASADANAPVPPTLSNIESIRTLATVQIPPDAFLIVEAENPREHLPEAGIALVLLVFASVNLVGLVKGLRA